MFILIAGDDILFPADVVDNIRDWGHRVEIALTGREAIMRAKRIPFDLVMLDVLMQDISGQVLIPQIKNMRPETRIVAATVYNTEQLEKEIRTLGICCYLTKPFLMEELKSVLDHTQDSLLKQALPANAPAIERIKPFSGSGFRRGTDAGR